MPARPTSRDTVTLITPLAAIVAVVIVGANGSVSFQGTILTLLANMVIVVGLQIFLGNSGVYSFGSIAFVALGAYASAIVTLPTVVRLSYLPNLPGPVRGVMVGILAGTLIGALIATIVAVVVALPLMRTSVLAIPISTLAFVIVVREVIANWTALTGGTPGLIGVPTTTTLTASGAWAAVAVVVALVFKRSRIGYRLQASRENEIAAKSIGIGVTRERVIAFAVSGFLLGVGGALAAHHDLSITPDTFYFDLTLVTLTMLIVGGMRSVWGAVLGTIVVSTINELLHQAENGVNLGFVSIPSKPGLAPIGVSIVLIIVLITLPAGLTGGHEAGDLAVIEKVTSVLRRHLAGRRPSGTSVPATAKGLASVSSDEERSPLSIAQKLVAARVGVSFGGVRALDDLSLTLRAGEILGLIGPNGAGKTTLVNVLSGFQRPTQGRVTIDDVDVTAMAPNRLVRRGLARTFQSALPFPQMTVRENVAVGAMGVGRSRVRAFEIADNVLVRLDLSHRANALAGALPTGDERLLGIARALATEPRFLLLDEPAAGLNEREGAELVASLRRIQGEFGCGVLVIEHDMSVIMPLCSRLQVLDNGSTLREGTPEAIRGDPAVIEAYLGTSFVAEAHA